MNELFKAEIRRKTLHIILTGFPLLFVASEFARINCKIKTPTSILIKLISRTGEIKEPNRMRWPFWIFAHAFIILVFNYYILWIALIVCAFGDSAGGIIHPLIRKERNYSAWLNVIAGALICSPLIYLPTQNIALALGASFIGMLGTFTAPKINDNLSIPLLAAVATWGIISFL